MANDRIAADPETLFEVASKVGHLADQLAQAEAHFGDGWYESHDIESALSEFVRAWSDRRSQLVELLRASHTILTAAGNGFLEIDSSMASALKGEATKNAS